MTNATNTIPERIYASWFCDFEPDVKAHPLNSGDHEDWYDHERAAAIADKCEVCDGPGGHWTWAKAYFAILNYRFHDEKGHFGKDICAYDQIAGPFLTEEEALDAAKAGFADAVNNLFVSGERL